MSDTVQSPFIDLAAQHKCVIRDATAVEGVTWIEFPETVLASIGDNQLTKLEAQFLDHLFSSVESYIGEIIACMQRLAPDGDATILGEASIVDICCQDSRVIQCLEEAKATAIADRTKIGKRLQKLTAEAPPEVFQHAGQMLTFLKSVGSAGQSNEARDVAVSLVKAAIAANKLKKGMRLSDEETATRMVAIQESNLTVDQKMRAFYALDNRVLGWDSNRWADVLCCTPQAVRDADWWKTDRKRLSERD